MEQGATEREVAKKLGIAYSSFNKYKSTEVEFSELLLNSKKRNSEENCNPLSWTVYKHVFPNGKVYIGITGKPVNVRWANGKGYSPKTYVGKAIAKYGWENVQHEILFDGLSEQEAKRKEIELIEEYQSYSSEYGYNLTKGGDGQSLTPEQRRQRILKRRDLGSVMFAKSIDDVIDNLEVVKELSKRGISKEDIARKFGVSKQTWFSWEKEEPYIGEAIALGRIDVCDEIKAAMFKRATGFQYEEKKVITQAIEFNDPELGKIPAKLIRTEVTTKTALPDVAAGLVLLKHWDEDSEWTSDPQTLKLKKEELELKKKSAEQNIWMSGG